MRGPRDELFWINTQLQFGVEPAYVNHGTRSLNEVLMTSALGYYQTRRPV